MSTAILTPDASRLHSEAREQGKLSADPGIVGTLLKQARPWTLDPAENIDFARPLTQTLIPLDPRSSKDLRVAAFSENTALERERAVWELAHRLKLEALPVLKDFLSSETDRNARSHVLWLALQVAGLKSLELLARHTVDDDPEVADWASLLVSELTGEPRRAVYSGAGVEENRAFDQTLPLVVSGSVLVDVPGAGTIGGVFGPMWFDSIMGRLMACTDQATFHNNLVVEKAYPGLHADGTYHYEIYKFAGMCHQLASNVFEHNFQSLTHREFYTSGRVKEGVPSMVPIDLARVAITALAEKGEYEILGEGERANRLRQADLPFVKSVRGRYNGFAAIDLQRLAGVGEVGGGDVQLSNPSDPISAAMTNTRLFGLFRGKAADLTGSGHLTLNEIPCHGTKDGRLDLNCDGSCIEDPYIPKA